MRAQTILFLSVDGVKEKLDCRPYRGRGEGNPKKLVEAASRAFPTLSIILTIRVNGVDLGAHRDHADLAAGWNTAGWNVDLPLSLSVPTAHMASPKPVWARTRIQ